MRMLTAALCIFFRNCKYTRYPLQEEYMNKVIYSDTHVPNTWGFPLKYYAACKKTYTKE